MICERTHLKHSSQQDASFGISDQYLFIFQKINIMKLVVIIVLLCRTNAYSFSPNMIELKTERLHSNITMMNAEYTQAPVSANNICLTEG